MDEQCFRPLNPGARLKRTDAGKAAAEPRLHDAATAADGPSADRSSGDVDYLIEMARVHAKYGHADKAEELYRTVIEKESIASRKSAAREALAALLLKEGKAKEAASELAA